MKIRNKILFSYIVLIIFSVILSTSITSSVSKNRIFTEVEEKTQTITELIYSLSSMRSDLITSNIDSDLQFIEKHLNSIGKVTTSVSSSYEPKNNETPNVYIGNVLINNNNSFLSDVYDPNKEILNIFSFNGTDFIRISSNLPHDILKTLDSSIPHNSPLYKKLLKGETYLGTTCILEEDYTAGFAPLFSSTGDIVGAISISYKNLDDSLLKTIKEMQIGDTGYIYIINSESETIYHPDYSRKNSFDTDFAETIVKNKNGTIEYEYKGVEKLAVYKYFEPWDWYIVTTANYRDLSSSWDIIYRTAFLVAIMTIIISIIFAVFLANRFVRPLHKLKHYMEIAGSGNLKVRSNINSKDEFSTLSDSFNKMVTNHQKSVAEIIKYDKIKNDFFANISHELRTPLNIIFSTSQLFNIYIEKLNDDENISTKLCTYNKTIKQNCYRLLRLVNNLIDINRIDSGFLKPKLKNLNIVEVVENITLSTVEYIESKDREIIFDTISEEIITAIDSQHMERIILNLISNAVKFTKPGDSIYVSILEKNSSVVISVRDTGIGIPFDKQAHIFERFKQVDPLLSRRHEGSGIGLSLVKSLVELHGGNILLSSIYGEGSNFILTLPIKLCDNNISEDDLGNLQSDSNVEQIEIEFSDIYS